MLRFAQRCKRSAPFSTVMSWLHSLPSSSTVKRSVTWNPSTLRRPCQDVYVYYAVKHSDCHTCRLCIFPPVNSNMSLELFCPPQSLCDRIVQTAILPNLRSFFLVKLPVILRVKYKILNVTWARTLNHNEDSRHVEPLPSCLACSSDTRSFVAFRMSGIDGAAA